MKKKIVLLGTCIALLCTGCGTSLDELTNNVVSNIEDAANDSTETETPSPEEEGEAEGEDTGDSKEEELLSLGDKATVGNWKFTVKGISVKGKIPNGDYYAFEPDKGEKFVCINISVKNNGKEEATFLPRIAYNDEVIAQLYYEDYEYKATELVSYDKDLCGESIKPLTTKKGIIAFAVPAKVAKKKGKLTLKIGTADESVTYSLKK